MEHHLQAVEDGPRRASVRTRHVAPQAWAAFNDLHQAALADGSVPSHIKELVAMAVGVIQHSDEAVEHHAVAAVRTGATREQAAEILAVVLLMGDSTSSTWAPRALQAFDRAEATSVAVA